MRKFVFAMTALAAFTLWGCSNEDVTDGEQGVVKGEKARLSITLNLPTGAAGTRANDGDPLVGTEVESKISAVDVFVFETNGTLAETGGHTTIAVTTGAGGNFTLDQTSAYDVYKLNASEAIATVSGQKHIYVVGNAPSTISGLTSESALLAAFETVTNLCGDNEFTMVSDAADVNQTLKAADPADAATGDVDNQLNTFTTNLTRVVAKVVASSNAAAYSKTWAAATTAPAPAMNLVYTIRAFRTIQGATKSYVAPNFWSVGGLIKTYPGVAPTPVASIAAAVDPFNSFDTDAAAVAVNIPTAHPADADLNKLAGFYVGENYPVNADKAVYTLDGNTTYIYVSTTVTANVAAYWVPEDVNGDNTIDPTEGHVAWLDLSTAPYGNVDPDNALSANNTDIYVVHANDGKQYVTDATHKDALAIGLGIDKDPTKNANGEGIFVYTKGWVHFQAWLNKNGMNDYSVLRNEFIHVKINDVISNDYLFPGYPGNPTSPDHPTTPQDPQGPDPQKPNDPVDGENAFLNIDVTVNPWVYKPNETVLGQ